MESESDERPPKGFFITLYDTDSLVQCLTQGVYGQYLSPEHGEPETYHHYKALADFASARAGDHVFFFHDRRIYYGGQLRGNADAGAFYLNGQYSPLGRSAAAPLVWDESQRDAYDATDTPGVFELETRSTTRRVCQPYLFCFDDPHDLAGTYISSDDLYLELNQYGYPLPSNTISGMAFCTLTPGETDHLLSLLKTAPRGELSDTAGTGVTLEADPVPYKPAYGVDALTATTSEAHLEASVLAHPALLPSDLQNAAATYCRQVPVSPYKPDPDRADICAYTADSLQSRTVPATVLELKHSRAGKQAALQVKRYLDWLQTQFGDDATTVDVAILAPSFTSTFDSYLPDAYRTRLERYAYEPTGR